MEEWLATAGVWASIIGAGLVGALTAVRLRWVLAVGGALAAVLVAWVLWDVAWADESEFYDIGREGALILGLAFSGAGLALFAACAGLGRLARRFVCRRRAGASQQQAQSPEGAVVRRDDATVPRSRQRLVAMAGMVGVLFLAALLFALASLTSSGVFENTDPEDRARGDRLMLVAIVAAAAAVACLVGLGWRRRVVATIGALAVIACDVAVILEVSGDMSGGTSNALAIVLLAVIGVGLVAVWAAALPVVPRGRD
jgi:hypothetical protein